MDIQTILVPVDFSACSMQVTEQAAALARRLDARLILLHVGAPPDGVVGGEETLRRTGLSHLEPFVDAARRRGVASEARVRIGAVADGVQREAAAQRADLIVMGTHGRTGVARALLGSVAEQVSRHSDVPVMLIRRQHRDACASRDCR